MIIDPDLPIRLAAFETVKRLTALYGAVVPWEAIAKGFTYGEQSYYLATRARGIFRPVGMKGGALSIKTTVPRSGRTPRYDDLVDTEGGDFEYCLQGSDPDNRDNQLLAENLRLDAPMIYFYGINEGNYEPLWPVYMHRIDRSRLRCQVVVGESRRLPALNVMQIREREGIQDGQMTSVERRYATVTAKRRIHQSAFRLLVLRAYQDRCAICNLPKIQSLVEAAHIVPDCDEQGRPEVSNGLALCRLHHGAFDANLLGITPDHVVEIAPRLWQEKDGPVLEIGLKSFHQKQIHLPRRPDERPGQGYLKTRYEQFRKACWRLP